MGEARFIRFARGLPGEDAVDMVTLEYREVLTRLKFRFDQDRAAAILDQIEHAGIIVAASPLGHPLRDADDEPFLEVAITARVSCLITGSRRHFPAGSCQRLNVLSPQEFLAFYRQHAARE